jgi:hypothetical protein
VGRLFRRGGAFAAALLAALPASAHVRQRYYLPSNAENTRGQESIIHWPFASNVRVNMHQFSGTLGRGSTLDYPTTRSLVASAFGEWKGTFFGGLTASLDRLDLAGDGAPYASSSGCEGIAETDAGGNHKPDQVNNIVFTTKRDSACSSSLTANTGVIGLTRVVFDVTNGQIVEADIQFDDDEFLFRDSPPNNLALSPRRIYLKDVLTHEIGHFLGLDHSSAREATMLFAVSDGLATVANDDAAGILSLYPPASATTASSLRGSVTDAAGTPVFGAAVFVLDARTLGVKASEMTDANGAFRFCSLAPGPQVVYADAYRPFGGNIHPYYSGDGEGQSIRGAYGCLNPSCEFMARDLRPAWLGTAASGGGFALSTLAAPAGSTPQFLNLKASTTDTAIPEVAGGEGTLALDEPRLALLGTGDLPLAGGAVATTHLWSFTAPASGSVQIRSSAFRLFSRLQLGLALYSTGPELDVTETACPPGDRHAADASYGEDPWMECAVTPGAVYKVRVSATAVACSSVPGNSPACASSGGETVSTARPVYALTVFDAALDGDPAGGSTAHYETSSLAAATYEGLPSCEEKSSATKSSAAKDESSGGGCCGTVKQFGEPWDGARSLLLTLLLNPISWVAAVYAARRRFRAV